MLNLINNQYIVIKKFINKKNQIFMIEYFKQEIMI